jgi:hypothetical protein
MGSQAGRSLIAQRDEGLTIIRATGFESDYQDALSYRRRIQDGTAHLGECTKAELLAHFDQLARAATAWRGKCMNRKA